MADLRLLAIRAALDGLYWLGAHRWVGHEARGLGAIFMLHHVRPERPSAFAPNAHLSVTPDFLDRALARLRSLGFAFVSMDEALARLRAPRDGAPFAAFTLDDGYRDNAGHAAPVFRRHACPYTVYVATDFAEGRGILWWAVMEEAIRRLSSVPTARLGRMAQALPQTLPAATDAQKTAAFAALYRVVVTAPEPERRAMATALAQEAGFEAQSVCRALCMDWEEVSALAADPLVTIGAHTASHPILATLGEDEARREIADGRALLETRLGRPVRHFAYPVGTAAAAGPREFALVARENFDSGVTTRRGPIVPAHAAGTEALPRVSLNGHFQRMRYVELFASGAPFVLARRLRGRSA